MTSCHNDRNLFRHKVCLSLSANAGRIDQAKALSIVLDLGIHGVPRSAWYRRDDHSFFSAEAVDQRRFSDIRPADYRDVDLAGLVPFFGRFTCRRRYYVKSRVKHIAQAVAVLRRYRVDRQPPAFEFERIGLELRGVDLVGGHENGFVQGSRKLGELLIERSNSDPRVYDEQHQHCIGQRASSLPENVSGDQLLFVRNDPSGINKAELSARPLDAAVDPVSCYSRLVAYNRAPRAYKSVEQCRFADIGPSQYDDPWQCARI